MHPNVLLELTTELIHRVLQLQHAMNQFSGEFEKGVRVHRGIILGR